MDGSRGGQEETPYHMVQASEWKVLSKPQHEQHMSLGGIHNSLNNKSRY